MKCLRIYTTEVDTGKLLSKIRIPLAVIRIVIGIVPPRVLEWLLDAEMEGEIAKTILRAIYQILMAVAANENGDIESGIIADVEEFSEELQGYLRTVVFVD